MKHSKYIPTGWRRLTPTEKVKIGDWFTSKENIKDDVVCSTFTPNEHPSCCNMGYMPVVDEDIHLLGKTAKQALDLCVFIRAKSTPNCIVNEESNEKLA